MDFGTLVTGESDIAYLAGLSRLEHRFNRAARSENQLGVGGANNFVKLNQIDSIGLQPAERVVQLLRGGPGVAPIKLGHQKYLLAVAVAQGFADSDLADAAIVIPAVIEKVYTAVDSHSDDSNAFCRGDVWPAEVIAANPYNRDFLARASECSARDVAGSRRTAKHRQDSYCRERRLKE